MIRSLVAGIRPGDACADHSPGLSPMGRAHPVLGPGQFGREMDPATAQVGQPRCDSAGAASSTGERSRSTRPKACWTTSVMAPSPMSMATPDTGPAAATSIRSGPHTGAQRCRHCPHQPAARMISSGATQRKMRWCHRRMPLPSGCGSPWISTRWANGCCGNGCGESDRTRHRARSTRRSAAGCGGAPAPNTVIIRDRGLPEPREPRRSRVAGNRHRSGCPARPLGARGRVRGFGADRAPVHP